MWENTVEHAKTCVLSGMLYVYYSDDTRSTGAVFNHIYELRGIISNGQFLSVESISNEQKVKFRLPVNISTVSMFIDVKVTQYYLPQISVDVLVKRAYDNWNHVVEYDGQALLNSMNGRQKPQPLPPPMVADFNSSGDQYLVPSTHTESYYSSENRSQSHPSAELALGDWPHTRDDRRFEDYFSEEEIRMRSSEILQHDDMQHMLRSFTSGDAACFSYAVSPFEPHGEYGIGQERSRGSTKAVVSWLKLKAAFRWGIFVRKRAAERRAQLVELD